MYNKYVNYLKDNPEGFWFKRKLYGWGWAPARWQGWAVIGGYVLVLIYLVKDVSKDALYTSDTLLKALAPIIIATAILIYICYKKGEKPRWQWGLPNKQ
jgi:hypothetical protein